MVKRIFLIKKIGTIASMLMIACPCVFADRIYFKDGHKINGEIIRETKDSVFIKQSIGRHGDIISNHPVGDIERIEKVSAEENIATELRRQQEADEQVSEVKPPKPIPAPQKEIQTKETTYSKKSPDTYSELLKQEQLTQLSILYERVHPIQKARVRRAMELREYSPEELASAYEQGKRDTGVITQFFSYFSEEQQYCVNEVLRRQRNF